MAPDLDNIRRFTDALESVLYDRSFNNERVDFFYDADVVIDMILGLFQFHGDEVRLTDSEYLVQALLSSGMFGTMHMLRPHALELDEKLRYQPDYRTAEGQELFRLQVNAFLAERGVDSSIEELHSIVQSDLAASRKHSVFVAALRRLGPLSFVAIEFVKGTWKQRLRRYWEKKQLVFDSTTPEMHVLFNTNEFRAVAAALAERRPPRQTPGPLNATTTSRVAGDAVAGSAAASALESLAAGRPAVSSVNNTRDAAALAALAYLMHQGRQVRFYTETRALQQILTRVSDIRAMFTNPPNSEHPGPEMARCVLRTDAYLLVRAYTEALTDSQKTEEDRLTAREEMTWVARQLRTVLTSHPRDLHAALSGLSIAGRRIGTIVRDIETLSFLQTVLRRNDFGDAVGDLHEWTDVWAFARGLLTTDVLDEQILNITDELHTHVVSLKTWFEHQERIDDASRYLRERWRGSIYPHAMRDLGLIRWGVQVDAKTDERIRALVSSILIDGEQASSTTSGSVVAAMADAPGSDDNVVVVCAVLWLLELFDLAFDVLSRHVATYGDQQNIPDAFRIWHVAAALRSTAIPRNEVVRLFAEADDSLARAHRRPAHDPILLGLGFIRFFAWRTGISESARASLEATEAAASDDRSMASAFAINQYAYVGTMAKLEANKTEVALARLRRFRSSNHWHYRFADTLAYSDMQKAERLLERGNLKPQERLLIRAQLATAHELLSSIVNTFGDSEIDEHILLFDQIYKRALECDVAVDLAPVRIGVHEPLKR